MALRVDLNKAYAIRAFEAAIASLKRSAVKAPNPAITELINKDINLYQTAINTITDIK